MNISLQGFDCKYATFRHSGDPQPGALVNVVADGTVATADGPFAGVLVSKHGGNALVQLSGYAKVAFSGQTPSHGLIAAAADEGVFAAAETGGRQVVVVDVDELAGTVGIIL